MENKATIIESINELTDKIRTDYPEMYRFLEETPIDIPVEKKIPTVTVRDLNLYYNTLKFMVKQHVDAAILLKIMP